MTKDKNARCNLDGKPIDPNDQAQIDRFAEWLGLTEAQRKWAIRTDSEWRAWLGIKETNGS